MLEILSLKLVIDFFDHLALYGITMKSVQIFLYRKSRGTYQFFSFSSAEDLYNFYYERYAPFEMCEGLGDIWGVNMFTVESSLNSFRMTFNAYDCGTDHWTVVDATQYDTDRNNVWKYEKERQIGLIDRTIAEYKGYYGELYYIYIHGVYSPCYAVPPWTEHTTVLHSYREYLIPDNYDQPQAPQYGLVINQI